MSVLEKKAGVEERYLRHCLTVLDPPQLDRIVDRPDQTVAPPNRR